MKEKITNPRKDPPGAMMLDYLNGDRNAFVTAESDNLDMWKMTGKTMFRTFGAMNRIERKALSLCHGKILDIGAGSGCHTLYLQDKKKQVHALDLSCGSIEVMKKRKVAHPIHDNLFSLTDKRYDTLLMLMNGIGIVGSLDGLNLFFQFIKTILETNGQVLVDSTDLASLYDPETLALADQEYYGHTRFTMTYKNITSDPFDWLYIDFNTLIFHAGLHDFECEKILEDKTGKYLARIIKKN